MSLVYSGRIGLAAVAACALGFVNAHAADTGIANGDIAASIADAGYFSGAGALGLSWRGNEFVNQGDFQSWYRLESPGTSLVAEELGASNPFSAVASSLGPTSARVAGSAAGLEMVQTFSMPSSSLLLVEVSLTNTTAAPIANVQWGVGLDPDQDMPTSSSFETFNSILGVDAAAAVRAVGPFSGFSIVLQNAGAAGALPIRAYIDTNDCCTPVNPAVALAAAQAPGTNANGDYSISLAYDIGTIGPGESASLSYSYALSQVAAPIPEPRVVAMLLVGLVTVGAYKRVLDRKRGRAAPADGTRDAAAA